MSLPPEALPLPQRLINCCSLLSDRIAMLSFLPRGAIFAEVGVALGDFSQTVMSVCDPALFIAIDEFRLHALPSLWERPTRELFGRHTHGESYRARFADAIAAGRMRVVEGDSADCLGRLTPASVDVIYIDAGHDYASVRRDLAAAHRAVAGDGWIILNDYIMVAGTNEADSYGVIHAANEFMIEHDWGLQYLALQTRMFCDVALRPARLLEGAGAGTAAVAAENQRLRTEIAELRESTCWRVTAPLRAVSTLAGKLRQ